jgi:DNA-binding MarR family transcriptional regulator
MHGDDSDISEVLGCTCLRLRKATRRVTQLYDRLLEPIGITTGQFGLLANMAGLSKTGTNALSMRALAERMGLDPTTLNRNLRPLAARGLLEVAADPTDKRVRTVHITDAGQAKLREALPYWRRAQGRLESALGTEARLALNELLDAAFARLNTL